LSQEQDFDEFDKILLHISMQRMIDPANSSSLLNQGEIEEIFKNRVRRSEISGAGFIAYLQYATI